MFWLLWLLFSIGFWTAVLTRDAWWMWWGIAVMVATMAMFWMYKREVK